MLRRIGKALLYIFILLVVAVAAVGWWLFIRPLPQTKGTLRLPGLRAAVEVIRDPTGMPHLRAQSLDDLYLAQGYVTAQDRLWQLELLRRVARGELSEFAGPRALPLDIEARTLGLGAAAEAAVTRLSADEKRWLTAYARGVNEFIRTGKLPVEFRLLRLLARPWTEADSAAIGLHMFRMLTTSWHDELLKETLLPRAGFARTAEMLPTKTERDHPPQLQIAGSCGADFSPAPYFAGLKSGCGLKPAPHEEGTPGSNNWVVSPAHSASGRAMLANDPHLEYSAPGIWTTVHLQAPGMNVAGVSLPGLPGVIIGHNEQIAWGMTNLGADVQDLFLEVVEPSNPRLFLVDGKWEEAQLRREVIHVSGERDRMLEVTVTRHGPLVVNEPGRRYALRWIALDAGAWRFPFTQINAARNWEEFTSALRNFAGPAQNFVYADAAGNIGYYAAGLLPRRQKGDGTIPLEGNDSANDWAGNIPFEELPHVYNPHSGIIATANARTFPDNYPYAVGTNWETPDRTERIYQLLDPNRKFTAEDFRRIQMDVYSAHHHKIARAVAEAVQVSGLQEPELLRAAEILRVWNGVATQNSVAATLAQVTRQLLLERLVNPLLGDRTGIYNWRMRSVFLENVLRDRPGHWLPPGASDYNQLLAGALRDALQTLKTRFATADIQQWRWGRFMATSFVHPVGGQVRGLRRLFNFGPFEQPGTAYTVKQTTLTLGPSMRMVVDFANLDAATLTLATGVSGHPTSSHYRDQFPQWLSGQGVPLRFKVEAGWEKLTLEP